MRPSARAKLRAPEISLIKICKFRGAGGRRVSIANVVGATVSRWGTVIETQLSICTRITTQRYSRFAAKVVIANGTPSGWRGWGFAFVAQRVTAGDGFSQIQNWTTGQLSTIPRYFSDLVRRDRLTARK